MGVIKSKDAAVEYLHLVSNALQEERYVSWRNVKALHYICAYQLVKNYPTLVSKGMMTKISWTISFWKERSIISPSNDPGQAPILPTTPMPTSLLVLKTHSPEVAGDKKPASQNVVPRLAAAMPPAQANEMAVHAAPDEVQATASATPGVVSVPDAATRATSRRSARLRNLRR